MPGRSVGRFGADNLDCDCPPPNSGEHGENERRQKCARSSRNAERISNLPVPLSSSDFSSSQVAECGIKTAFKPDCSAGLMSLRGLFPTIQPCDFTILNCSIIRP